MKIQRTTAISFESWFFSAVLPYMAGASEASAKPSQAKYSCDLLEYYSKDCKRLFYTSFLQSFFLFKFSHGIYERLLRFYPTLTESYDYKPNSTHKNINIQP